MAQVSATSAIGELRLLNVVVNIDDEALLTNFVDNGLFSELTDQVTCDSVSVDSTRSDLSIDSFNAIRLGNEILSTLNLDFRLKYDLDATSTVPYADDHVYGEFNARCTCAIVVEKPICNENVFINEIDGHRLSIDEDCSLRAMVNGARSEYIDIDPLTIARLIDTVSQISAEIS